MEGKVKFWNKEKGFGFVRLDDGREFFMHLSAMKDANSAWRRSVPSEGTLLHNIQVGEGRRGKTAIVFAETAAAVSDRQKKEKKDAMRKSFKKIIMNLEENPQDSLEMKLTENYLGHMRVSVFYRNHGMYLGNILKYGEKPDLKLAQNRFQKILEDLPVIQKLLVILASSQYHEKLLLSYSEAEFGVHPIENGWTKKIIPLLGDPEEALRCLLLGEIPRREKIFSGAVGKVKGFPHIGLKKGDQAWVEILKVYDFEKECWEEIKVEELVKFLRESAVRASEIEAEIEETLAGHHSKDDLVWCQGTQNYTIVLRGSEKKFSSNVVARLTFFRAIELGLRTELYQKVDDEALKGAVLVDQMGSVSFETESPDGRGSRDVDLLEGDLVFGDLIVQISALIGEPEPGIEAYIRKASEKNKEEE